jgi:hypothetical protein
VCRLVNGKSTAKFTGNRAFARGVLNWAFQRTGVLRIAHTDHHRVNQTRSEYYRIKDDMVRERSCAQACQETCTSLFFWLCVHVCMSVCVCDVGACKRRSVGACRYWCNTTGDAVTGVRGPH